MNPENLSAFCEQARNWIEERCPEYGENPRLHLRMKKGAKQLAVIEAEAERQATKREPLRLMR